MLLLHGLAGHAEEWAQTASWLTARSRVIAMDLRGHGRSGRVPQDVSRDAHVADAAFVVEQLGLRPVVVVGQSLGGLTALSLAARRPDLTRALVLLDARPAGGRDDADAAATDMGERLGQWPVPFTSRAEALQFFEDRFGTPLAAEAWANGLEQRTHGWWPRFEVEVMVRTLREAVAEPSWEEWERISCPALIVRPENGIVDPDLAGEMVERLPSATLIEVPNAAHDVHLDKPDAWREALSSFLDSLDG